MREPSLMIVAWRYAMPSGGWYGGGSGCAFTVGHKIRKTQPTHMQALDFMSGPLRCNLPSCVVWTDPVPADRTVLALMPRPVAFILRRFDSSANQLRGDFTDVSDCVPSTLG